MATTVVWEHVRRTRRAAGARQANASRSGSTPGHMGRTTACGAGHRTASRLTSDGRGTDGQSEREPSTSVPMHAPWSLPHSYSTLPRAVRTRSGQQKWEPRTASSSSAPSAAGGAASLQTRCCTRWSLLKALAKMHRPSSSHRRQLISSAVSTLHPDSSRPDDVQTPATGSTNCYCKKEITTNGPHHRQVHLNPCA